MNSPIERPLSRTTNFSYSHCQLTCNVYPWNKDLPISRLPQHQQRGGQNSIGVRLGKVADSLVQPSQGNRSMLYV